jgi:hypothetical protein
VYPKTYNMHVAVPKQCAKTYCTNTSKDCSSNFRSKHSTVLVLCLLRKLLEQSLGSENIIGFAGNSTTFSVCHYRILIENLESNITIGSSI